MDANADQPSGVMGLPTTFANRRILVLSVEARGEAARVALATFHEIAVDKTAQATARIGAARALGEIAGLLGVGKETLGSGKEPQEMSTDELHDLVGKLSGELAGRAKPIVPRSEPNLRQVTDLLD